MNRMSPYLQPAISRMRGLLSGGRSSAIAVGCGALVICLIGISTPALWWDEGATWVAATSKVGALFRFLASKDAVLGPYYLAEHFWTLLVGDSEAALRFPSAVAMGACAGVVVLLGRRWYGGRTGLVAGLMFAVLPAVSRYGQEAKPYALTCLFGAASTLFLLIALEERRWRWWAAYAAAIAMLGAAQVTAIILVAGHLVLAQRRRGLLPFAISAGLGSAPIMALAAIGWTQRFAIAWIPLSSLESLASVLPTLLGGSALAFMAAVVALRANRVAAFEPLLVAVIPVLILFAVGFVTPVFQGRYLLSTLPVGLVTIGALLSDIGTRRILVVVLLLGALTLSEHGNLRASAGHGIDARAAAAWITDRCEPGDIYLPFDLTALPVRYYLAHAAGCAPIASPVDRVGRATRAFILRGAGTPGAAAGPLGFHYLTGQRFTGIVVTLYARP